jgi:hypothetical protein
MDSSEYYWLPWLYTYQKLQAATRTGTPGFDKDLKQVQHWLQDGASRFKPPSEQSAAALKKGGNLKATAYGPGKGVAIDKQLVQATLELSQLLVSGWAIDSSLQRGAVDSLALANTASLGGQSVQHNSEHRNALSYCRSTSSSSSNSTWFHSATAHCCDEVPCRCFSPLLLLLPCCCCPGLG